MHAPTRIHCSTLPRWAVEDWRRTRRPRMEHQCGLAGAPALEDLAADRLLAAMLPDLPRTPATVAGASSESSAPCPSGTAQVLEASAPKSATSNEIVLATPIRLARGVKVAQVVLVHLVLVRIQAGQFRSLPEADCVAAPLKVPRCRTLRTTRAAASSP
jgi:hypothetical protein